MVYLGSLLYYTDYSMIGERREKVYLIAGAMKGEIKATVGALERAEEERWPHDRPHTTFSRGRLAGAELVVCRSGVGKILTAASLQYAIDRYSPSAVIFIGLAGALNPSYAIGDTLIAESCGQWDMDATRFGFKRGKTPYVSGNRFISSDPRLVAAAREAAGTSAMSGGGLHTGRLLSGDTFLTDRNSGRFSFLTEEMHGDAVDMEGYAAAAVASLNSVSFVAIKMISDLADGTVSIKLAPLLMRASRAFRDCVSHVLCTLSENK